MNKILTIAIALIFVLSGFKQGSDSIAKGLGIYIFPTNGQDADQQEFDEYKCFKWAKEETGYDPLNPPDINAQPAQTGRDGSAIRTTGKSAAAGAAIGAIAGDAGKGAAIGATVGGFASLRQRGAQNAQAKASAEHSVQTQQAALLDGFKRAFSVCMEANGYNVK